MAKAKKINEDEEDFGLEKNVASKPFSLKSVSAISLDFNKLDKNGVKKQIADKITRGTSYEVEDIKANNTAKRANGVLQKEFTIKFKDGQDIKIGVKSDGTIFEFWLNGKNTPIKNADNMKKAIEEMKGLLKRGADYKAKLEQARKNRKIRPLKMNVNTSRKKRTEEAMQELEETQALINETKEKMEAEKAGRDKKAAELDKITKELDDEKAITPQLEGEIETVKQEIADGEAQEAEEQAQEEREAAEAAKEEAADTTA